MQRYTFETKPVNTYSSVESIIRLIDLVVENPQKATQVATGLIGFGVLILFLVAISSS